MKTIVEISCEGSPGTKDNWFEVYDDEHSNPQNPSKKSVKSVKVLNQTRIIPKHP